MKSLLMTAGIFFLAIGPGTFIVMAYRYIWFATEPVPADRIGYALLAACAFTLLSIPLFVFSSDEAV